MVNRHSALMIDVIQADRGIIVDFLGDAILAFFDPLDGPRGPVVRRAISCSLNLHMVMEAENLAESGVSGTAHGHRPSCGRGGGGEHRFRVPGEIRHYRLRG